MMPAPLPRELCRARHPITGEQCIFEGPHEKHATTQKTYQGGDVVSTWHTCNAPLENGRICLLVLRHVGGHK